MTTKMTLFYALPNDLQKLLMCHVSLFDFPTLSNLEPFSKFVTTLEFWKYLYKMNMPSTYIEDLELPLYKSLYLKLWRQHYLNSNKFEDSSKFLNKNAIDELNKKIKFHDSMLHDNIRKKNDLQSQYEEHHELHTRKVKLLSFLHIPTSGVHQLWSYQQNLYVLSEKIDDEFFHIKRLEEDLVRQKNNAHDMQHEYNMKLQSDSARLIRQLTNDCKLFPLSFYAYEIILNNDDELPDENIYGLENIKNFLMKYNNNEILLWPTKHRVDKIISNHGTLVKLISLDKIVLCWFNFKKEMIHCSSKNEIPYFVKNKNNLYSCVYANYNVPKAWFDVEDDDMASSSSSYSSASSSYSSSSSSSSMSY